jgi:hypothetical protein
MQAPQDWNSKSHNPKGIPSPLLHGIAWIAPPIPQKALLQPATFQKDSSRFSYQTKLAGLLGICPRIQFDFFSLYISHLY